MRFRNTVQYARYRPDADIDEDSGVHHWKHGNHRQCQSVEVRKHYRNPHIALSKRDQGVWKPVKPGTQRVHVKILLPGRQLLINS